MTILPTLCDGAYITTNRLNELYAQTVLKRPEDPKIILRDFKASSESLKTFLSEEDRNLWWECPLNVSFLSENTAVIPIYGDLVHISPHYYSEDITSYKSIRKTLDLLVTAGKTTIILDIASYGGQATGLFDLTDYIYEVSQKPDLTLIGFTESYACSAAQAILSSCKYSYATASSQLGSIGAMLVHLSYQEQLKNSGVKVSLITSGSLKALGNPYKNLTNEELAIFQTSVDLLSETYIDKLRVYKQNIDAAAIKDLEAAIITPETALHLNLITGIKEFKDIMAETPTPKELPVNTDNVETSPIKPQEALSAVEQERDRVIYIDTTIETYGNSEALKDLRKVLVSAGLSKETCLSLIKATAAATTVSVATAVIPKENVIEASSKNTLLDKLNQIKARLG